MTCRECKDWKTCPDRSRMYPCRRFRLREMKTGELIGYEKDGLNGLMNQLRREGYSFEKVPEEKALRITGAPEEDKKKG